MTVEKQNPREPRDFYHLLRPNTVLWAARLVTIVPFVIFSLMWGIATLGMSTNVDANPNLINFIMNALLVTCWVVSPMLKAGIWQYTNRKHMDEFEWARVEKSRLFAYRMLTIFLLVIFICVPFLHGFFDGLSSGVVHEGIEEGVHKDGGLYRDTIAWLILFAFTLAPAYYHWTLKPVPPEENIRPDPPFMTDDDVAKGFWRR